MSECWSLLSKIVDPEIPVVTIAELGILREIDIQADGTVLVHITPTYSGCPAMLAIRDTIEQTLRKYGVTKVLVRQRLAPAWTTDWISQEAREKLRAYGIAPPGEGNSGIAADAQALTARSELDVPLFVSKIVACPRCNSDNTRRVSAFGATACQEQWRCLHCSEPFSHFKCH